MDSLRCRLDVRCERRVIVVRITSAMKRSHVGNGRRIVSVKQVVGREEWEEDVLCSMLISGIET